VFIADGKWWQEHGDAYVADHVNGTGPYVLKSWRRDDALELDANPRYWGGAPAIAHVTFKPIPEAGTRASALRTGATDLITNVPFQYATLLAGGTTTRMASARSVRVLFIAFNTMQPGPQQNVLVRQALNYAIDVPAIVKAVRDANLRIDGFSATNVGGIVVLKGTSDAASAQQAAAVVKQLGFARVANLIVTRVAANDDTIRREAERQLTLTRALDGCTLHVSCVNGILRVDGTAYNELQVDVARKVLKNVGAQQVQVALKKL